MTVLLGACQTGKTTLSRVVTVIIENKAGEEVHRFDLEQAPSRAALAAPEIALKQLRGLVVIDESQRLPQLFETMRRFWTMLAHYHGGTFKLIIGVV